MKKFFNLSDEISNILYSISSGMLSLPQTKINKFHLTKSLVPIPKVWYSSSWEEKSMIRPPNKKLNFVLFAEEKAFQILKWLQNWLENLQKPTKHRKNKTQLTRGLKNHITTQFALPGNSESTIKASLLYSAWSFSYLVFPGLHSA